jgi:hypothetical protein
MMTQKHLDAVDLSARIELGEESVDVVEYNTLMEVVAHLRALVNGDSVVVPRKEIKGWLSDILLIPATLTEDANALEAIYSNINYWLRLTSEESKE